MEKFGCVLSILYSGQYLDDVIPKGAPNCINDITLEALDFVLKKESKCPKVQTCEKTRFLMSYVNQPTWNKNKSVISVTYKTPEVEYSNTYINYGVISLIGEIGGILGLTLGASALTLLESLFQQLPYY